jgi:hypothetical protein
MLPLFNELTEPHLAFKIDKKYSYYAFSPLNVEESAATKEEDEYAIPEGEEGN